MRVILDTNVVVSALIWGGKPYRLLQAAVDGEIELFTSPVLIDELRNVLSRSPLASRLAQQRDSAEQAVALYGQFAISLSPLETPRVVPDDTDDDHVLACAVAAQADLIVSGDNDLLNLNAYKGIRILSPNKAAELLQQAQR